jgi:hypothetical protein
MIEALACGTPVVAWRNGSVPEVIEDGVTGFVVSSIEEAAQAVGHIAGLSRETCRKVFEERFDASRMAADYLEVYHRLVRGGSERVHSAIPAPELKALSSWQGFERRTVSHSQASAQEVLPCVE